MIIQNGLSKLVGNTPIMRLPLLSEATGCEILAKCEFMNPGGSVKDRAALSIIETAEKEGKLKPGLNSGVNQGLSPGMTIVEGTAGNTGIGLTVIGLSKGYRVHLVIPNTQSKDKIDLLKALGANVELVPPAEYSNANNYQHIAKRRALEIGNAFWADQFDNTANRNAHFNTTGPEIWRQTDGKLTSFVSVVGTGGTIGGTTEFLKSVNSKVHCVLADPHGASIYSWVRFGHLNYDEGDSFTEGIGQARITANLANAKIDTAYRFSDKIIFEMVDFLRRNEGLFLGTSSALNVCGAIKQAITGGPGQVIATLLCDGGGRYTSKIFNPDWLSKNLLTPMGLNLNELIELIRTEVQPDDSQT